MTGYKRLRNRVLYICLLENLVIRFSFSFACNKLVTMLACKHYSNNILTERFLAILCLRFTELFTSFSVKFRTFLNNSLPCFLQYLPAKFYEILRSGSQEICAFPRKLLNWFNRNFFTNYACAAFKWVLTVMTKNLKNYWILCILTFSDILYKRKTKPTTHCVILRRIIPHVGPG